MIEDSSTLETLAKQLGAGATVAIILIVIFLKYLEKRQAKAFDGCKYPYKGYLTPHLDRIERIYEDGIRRQESDKNLVRSIDALAGHIQDLTIIATRLENHYQTRVAAFDRRNQ